MKELTKKQKQALALGRKKGIKRNRPSGLKYTLHKENPTSFKKGITPWNKGKKIKSNKEYSLGYDAIHEWVERWIGRSDCCNFCGGDRFLEIANKSGEYKREEKDWMTLCKKCHHRYDYEQFGAREVFFQ